MLCPFLEGGFGPTVDIDDYSAGLLESVIPASLHHANPQSASPASRNI
jgi:hypothetical protein